MKKLALALVLLAGLVGMAHAGSFEADMHQINLELDGNLAGTYDSDC